MAGYVRQRPTGNGADSGGMYPGPSDRLALVQAQRRRLGERPVGFGASPEAGSVRAPSVLSLADRGRRSPPYSGVSRWASA
ncbi:hypothetical protein PZ61_0200085 [Streptomyces sp. MNU77]|nr:hypothetical protein PZ61_0200085 [Streptomyces sp. MNU77]